MHYYTIIIICPTHSADITVGGIQPQHYRTIQNLYLHIAKFDKITSSINTCEAAMVVGRLRILVFASLCYSINVSYNYRIKFFSS